MDIVCDKCSTKIKIPDQKLEKIPEGQVFAINCPKCKNKISVNKSAATSASKSTAAPAKSTPPPSKSPASNTPINGSDSTPSDNPFGFLEEGAQTAMLCEPDVASRSIMKGVLEKMEYHISEPPSPREALKQMRAHEFQTIVLNERFGTPDPEANPVLKYLASLKMNIRRNMFVALISNRFSTMDKMRAFNKSVNVIINAKDIKEFEKYFTHSYHEYEAFYRVYKELFDKLKG